MLDDHLKAPPAVLNHYTDSAGLLGIVKGRALWATHIKFLNDSREFIHALDIARGFLKRMKAQNDVNLVDALLNILDAFPASSCIISFTEDGDLLSQWRGYCRFGGYSLSFHTSKLMEAAAAQNYQLVQCIYDRNEQERLIEALLFDAVNEFPTFEAYGELGPSANEIARANLFAFNWFSLKMSRLASVMKDPAFREEREWRLVGPLFNANGKMGFRARGALVIPYDVFNLESNVPHAFQGVIDRVLVGPNPDQETALLGVQILHNWGDLSDAQIDVSTIPYRTP